VLRLEGLADPGADATALRGARPYVPGNGSEGGRLARRARELGLAAPDHTYAGTLQEVVRSIDDGRPVIISGANGFVATTASGERRERGYRSGHYLVAVGYAKDASGRVAAVTLNDPDSGQRLTMTRGAFDRFFDRGGGYWMITYGG
jgi:hypothetical protein